MKPTDTSKRFLQNAHMLFGGDPVGIEAMERHGREELVRSEYLPTDGIAKYKKPLERWGFSFGVTDLEDPLFTEAQLPPGWRKRGTEHAMWSEILDAEHRVRLSLFYKAAFYDRRAFLRVEPRYVEVDSDDRTSFDLRDAKSGKVLFSAAYPEDPDDYHGKKARWDDVREWATKHLGENFLDPERWDDE